jgi:hypothetical protein
MRINNNMQKLANAIPIGQFRQIHPICIIVSHVDQNCSIYLMSSEEGLWSSSGEWSFEFLWFLGNLSNDWELQVWFDELDNICSLNFVVCNFSSLDNVNGRKSSSMTGSHIQIHLVNCSSEFGISIFLVHVVNTTS